MSRVCDSSLGYRFRIEMRAILSSEMGISFLYSWLFADHNLMQFNFRVNALAGNLAGVKKASW